MPSCPFHGAAWTRMRPVTGCTIDDDVAPVGLAPAAGRRVPRQEHAERRRRRRPAPRRASATAKTSRRRSRGRARRSTSSQSPCSSRRRHELFEQLVHVCTSSRAPPQRPPRGGERGADRARADRERVGDRRVVEVGVVVEKDDLALPFGQQLERQHRRVAVRGGVVRLGERGPPPARVACRVDDDPPDPRLERAAAAEASGACGRRSRMPPAPRRSRAPGRRRSRRRRAGTPAAARGTALRADRSSTSTTRERAGFFTRDRRRAPRPRRRGRG